MGLIAAKCSECGAPIEVDDTRKFGFCPNCGTKYVTQDVVQNFQQNYYTINQNKIENAVFQGGDTERTYFERFDAFRRLGQLVQAIDVAEQMREKFPQKAITWYCSLYHACELSLRVFDDLVQRQIPNARGKMEHIFDEEETRRQIGQWFQTYEGQSAEVEKQLRALIDAKMRDAPEGEIAISPEEGNPSRARRMCAAWRSAPPCLKRRRTGGSTHPSWSGWRRRRRNLRAVWRRRTARLGSSMRNIEKRSKIGSAARWRNSAA